MKDRLRKRRRSLVMPEKYRRKNCIYGRSGAIQILTPSGERVDIGAATRDIQLDDLVMRMRKGLLDLRDMFPDAKLGF